MLIHSFVPPEYLVDPPPAPALETVSQNGMVFEGVWDRQDFIVSRLISTNPADYLNPSFAPGGRLRLNGPEEAEAF